jgi:ribonuclease J
VGEPEVVSSGFVDMPTDRELMAAAAQQVHQTLDHGAPQPMEWSFISAQVREVLGDYLYRETGRRPMIIPVPVEV